MIGFLPSALPPFRFLELEGVYVVDDDDEEEEEESERMGMGVVVAIEEERLIGGGKPCPETDGGDVTVIELLPCGGAD